MRTESEPTDEARPSGVSARVRSERARRRWNQAELALAAGLHPASVSNLERGCPVSPGTIAKVAAALGVQPEELAR